METNRAKKEQAALELLKETGLSVLEAALIARELLDATGSRGNKYKRAREIIRLGAEALRVKMMTVSFRKAAEEAIAARSDRRKRTQEDFRYMVRRLLRYNPGMGRRPVRMMTAKECREGLVRAFKSARQRHKARLVLSGIFSTAVRRGWCAENPVRWVDVPRLKEQVVPVLNMEEVNRLLKVAQEYRQGACLAAVGLMLYAGIRPNETERLEWRHINLEAGVVTLFPQHTKTGGARIVTIRPVLRDLLAACRKIGGIPGRVCPPNWQSRWRELRRLAGWDGKKKPWYPDTLRHTFASYFACHFKNMNVLQMEMGHASLDLLRTRYLNMEGVTEVTASVFWGSLPVGSGMQKMAASE